MAPSWQYLWFFERSVGFILFFESIQKGTATACNVLFIISLYLVIAVIKSDLIYTANKTKWHIIHKFLYLIFLCVVIISPTD